MTAVVATIVTIAPIAGRGLGPLPATATASTHASTFVIPIVLSPSPMVTVILAMAATVEMAEMVEMIMIPSELAVRALRLLPPFLVEVVMIATDLPKGTSHLGSTSQRGFKNLIHTVHRTILVVTIAVEAILPTATLRGIAVRRTGATTIPASPLVPARGDPCSSLQSVNC